MRAPRRSAPRSRGRTLRDLLVVVLVAVVASVLIKTFLIRSFFIPSASMEPTLLGDPGHHDRILVDELVPRVIPVQRGDVVVFRDPGGWLTPDAPVPSGPLGGLGELLGAVGLPIGDQGDHLVKRVIGLPGDRVACCTGLGQLTVNGAPLDEPYIRVPTGQTAGGEPFDVVVRPGDLWVMGDNRADSLDSRAHRDTATGGGVPIADVVGRAVVVSWPFARWRWLSAEADVFDGVPDPPAR